MPTRLLGREVSRSRISSLAAVPPLAGEGGCISKRYPELPCIPMTQPPPGPPGAVRPGDPVTLAYGTDQGRWLGQQLSGAPAAANPFRRQPQQW